MRLLLVVVLVVVALALAVVVAGYLLPVRHEATVSATIPAAPEAIWAALIDPAGYPGWRSDVTSVQVLAPIAGRPVWRETGKNGVITFAVEAEDAPHRLVTRITDRTLPFGGSWEYVISPEGTGSRVRITEHGEVYNPIFRFVSRFVMGHSATASAYLKALGRRFGAEVDPVVVGQTG